MRRWVFAVLALLVVAGLGGWFWALQNKTVQAVRESVSKLKDVELQAEVDVDLSLKGIELTQGKAGQLHWRLKAKRANYTQDRAEVLVEFPEIEYFYEKDNRTLKVMATHGVLQQAEDKARLWPDVRGAYEGNELRASELIYAGKERALTLSGDVSITGPKLQFRAAELKYLLTSNEILAEKGVWAVVMVPATGNRFGVLRGASENKSEAPAPGVSGASPRATPDSPAPPATPTTKGPPKKSDKGANPP